MSAAAALDPGTTAPSLRFSWARVPFVTGDLPGTGGRVREEPEDFRVEELPAYEPQGSGSHLYLRVEKRGLTTRDLVQALMAGGLAENQIGVAGLKDKHAVTVQWISIPKAFEEASRELDALPGARILERSYHRNKLGLGHLRGNRFEIVVRGVDAGAVATAGRVFGELSRRGSPNFFGPQRFGRFGSNAIDGLAVVRGERVPGGHRLRRFFVSALQSLVFNDLLALRIGSGRYDSVLSGDWARRHDSGGVFKVDDPVAESARAARLEISALLPLHGRRVRLAEGEAGELEREVLERYGLAWSAFGSRRGDRRASRLVVADPEVTAAGADAVRLAFSLPKGSYATVVLREVMKVDVDAPSEPSADRRAPAAGEDAAGGDGDDGDEDDGRQDDGFDDT